jgi:excisionase family DNA binding protein
MASSANSTRFDVHADNSAAEPFKDVATELKNGRVVLACVILMNEQAAPVLALFHKAVSGPPKDEPMTATMIRPVAVPEPDQWLQHSEAARYLGISRSTLYRYAEQGHIESRKLGNRLEYRRSSLDKFKDQHVRPARRGPRGCGIIPAALSSGN